MPWITCSMVAIEISGKKAPYAFGSGFCYSFFRYDTGNIGGGGYIEGRIFGLTARGRDPYAFKNALIRPTPGI